MFQESWMDRFASFLPGLNLQESECILPWVILNAYHHANECVDALLKQPRTTGSNAKQAIAEGLLAAVGRAARPAGRARQNARHWLRNATLAPSAVARARGSRSNCGRREGPREGEGDGQLGDCGLARACRSLRQNWVKLASMRRRWIPEVGISGISGLVAGQTSIR